MPRHQVFTRVVAEEANLSAYRITVDMYINWRHENRNLYPLIVKVFRFFGFLNHHYFPIRGAKYGMLVCCNSPPRIPEKLQNGDKQQERKNIGYPYHECIVRQKVVD